MTTKQLLLEATKVLESGWTKGAYARDAEGKGVVSISNSAVSWCALGALEKVASSLPHREQSKAVNNAISRLRGFLGTCGCSSIAKFNDEAKNKEVVIGVLKKAAL